MDELDAQIEKELAGIQSPATRRAMQPVKSVDQEIEEQLASAGIPDAPVDQEGLKTEKTNFGKGIIKLNKERSEQEKEMQSIKTKAAAIDAVAGWGQSWKELVTKSVNSLASINDSLNEIAAEAGFTPKEFLEKTPRWDGHIPGWQDKPDAYYDAQLGDAGRITKKISNAVAPFAIGVATSGGSLMTGVASDALYGLLADDPNSGNIANVTKEGLKGTWAEELPGLSQVISGLSTNPNDPEVLNRVRNMATNAGMGLGIAGLLKGVSWAAPEISKAVKNRFAIKNAVIEAGESAEAAAKATPVTKAEEAAVNQSDEAISAKAEAEQKLQVDPVEEAALKAEEPFDKVAAGKQLQDEMNPEGQMQLKERRVVDDIFGVAHGNAGKLKPVEFMAEPKEADIGFVYADEDEFEAAKAMISHHNEGVAIDRVRELLKDPAELHRAMAQADLPEVTNKNGTTIRAQHGYVVAMNKDDEVIAHIQLMPTVTKDGKLALTAAMMKREDSAMGQIKFDRNNAGIGDEMANYINKYIGDFVPSQNMTEAGAATARRTRQRADKVLKAETQAQVKAYQDAAEARRNAFINEQDVARNTGTNNSAEQGDLFEKQWAEAKLDAPPVYAKEDGSIGVNLHDADALDGFNRATIQINKQGRPKTDPELFAQAEKLLKNPEEVNRILNWKQADGPFSDIQIVAHDMILQGMDGEAKAAFSSFNENMTEAELAILLQKQQNYFKSIGIANGAASEAGAALRAYQLGQRMYQTGRKEFIKMIGAKGRAKLIANEIAKAGGPDEAKKVMLRLKEIADMPDSNFAVRMGEIVQKSRYMAYGDAITTVAHNAMLSNPATWLRAGLGNAVMTAKTTLDNFVDSAIPGGQSFAEASAHMNGLWAARAEAFSMAWDDMKHGTQSRAMNMDLQAGIPVAETQDQLVERAGLAFAEERGLNTAVNVLTAGQLPRRVLMGVDTFFKVINKRAYLNAAATRYAQAHSFADEAARTKFIEGFIAKPPYDIEQAADLMAARNTFSQDTLGNSAIEPLLSRANEVVPVMRVMLPFTRTTMAGIENAIRQSPLAILTEGRQAIAAGGRMKSEFLARVGTSSMALGALTWMTHSGYVTGKYTDNTELNKAFNNNKDIAPELSIKGPNGKWYSVRGIEPLSTVLEMVSTLTKASGYMSEGEYGNAAMTAMAIAGDAMTPEQWVDSLQGISDVIGGKEQGLDFLANRVTSFIPMSGAMRAIRNTMDDRQRMTRDMKNFTSTLKANLQNIVPEFSKDLPARRNIFGEAMRVPDGLPIDAISPYASTTDEGMGIKKSFEAIQQLQQEDANLGLYKVEARFPQKSVPNVYGASLGDGDLNQSPLQYDLSPKEYERLQLYSAGINPDTMEKYIGGKTLKERVEDILKNNGVYGKTVEQLKEEQFSNARYIGVVKSIHAVFNEYYTVGKEMMMNELVSNPEYKRQGDAYNKLDKMVGGE